MQSGVDPFAFKFLLVIILMGAQAGLWIWVILQARDLVPGWPKE